jgi:hypothetical protein
MTNANETTPKNVDTKHLHEELETWIATVRDPARERSEGERVVRTADGKAEARYEIALLPDGRFALHFGVQYHCGDHRGWFVPWTTFGTREECVVAFLEKSRRFFSAQVGMCDADEDDEEMSSYRTQRMARQKMLPLLESDGLFGFLEPEPMKVNALETDPRVDLSTDPMRTPNQA